MENRENEVRLHLEKEWDQRFSEKRLPVGLRADGEVAFKRFDAVSEDGRVVAMVKDYSAINKVGNRTRLAWVMQDLLYLHLVEADGKLMYISSPFFAWFKQEGDAAVPPDVSVHQIP